MVAENYEIPQLRPQAMPFKTSGNNSFGRRAIAEAIERDIEKKKA